MRLKSVHVTNYRSVVDSGPVEIDDICCFVGKNESGKTSFLTAVELLNPAAGDRQIDVVRDYPAWLLSEGEKAMEAGKPPNIVTATYRLSEDELPSSRIFSGPVRSRPLSLKCECVTTLSMSGPSALTKRRLWRT